MWVLFIEFQVNAAHASKATKHALKSNKETLKDFLEFYNLFLPTQSCGF